MPAMALTPLIWLGLLTSLLAAPSPQAGNDGTLAPEIDQSQPYKGPAVPIMDPTDQTISGNGQGYIRLWEAPAVMPIPGNPITNNINIISLSYLPGGMNVHFSTPFGIGGNPVVNWGTDVLSLTNSTTGYTHTYDRTPPCSMVNPTQCSQFFHEVQLYGLESDTKYYYQIPGGNGTQPSLTQSFVTARAPGHHPRPFTVAVVADMGYTDARGVHMQLLESAMDDNVAFTWHGGDISYADDEYNGLKECPGVYNASIPPDMQPICYNGSYSTQSEGVDDPDFYRSLKPGQIPHPDSPYGGDTSSFYEGAWDAWQQWMTPIMTRKPYMVLPGNHEVDCGASDGPGNTTTAYMLEGKPAGSTTNVSLTNYFTCPPSQRNFTAFSHRFRMPGKESSGKGNFWYSFDYGLAHFVSFNTETDFYDSGEAMLPADPTKSSPGSSGPFGYINGSSKVNANYEQIQWMQNDLASVNRTKTPWIFAFGHRPMYSGSGSAMQQAQANAFEDLFLQYGVDLHLAGHLHWWERLYPLGKNATIDMGSVINNHTYKVNNPKSMIHVVNGAGGNVEGHTQNKQTDLDAFVDNTHYGISHLTVYNETAALITFVNGGDGQYNPAYWQDSGEGQLQDYLWIMK